ncbi:hypothetical protein [Frigoribacterium sp. VKM Ac-2836]|uniref:hypothetical protein n=1 Tax=Frigoribacterium sp. VKM Ac-2836 TaxID=2739014 RepID=UPI0015665AD5|nr:hypothetical protein [Frigoribacterium sp. VKM Ac-2836]NRD25833.1 hypothetical protein [Frigoribacterium sp. VKM Ac-2836]
MSYTVVEVTMSSDQYLVALYVEDGLFEAERVLALATYRNPEEKGSPNVLVPIHADDLTMHQDHHALNRRILNQRLPQAVIHDRLLWDELDGHSSLIVSIDKATGKWVRA